MPDEESIFDSVSDSLTWLFHTPLIEGLGDILLIHCFPKDMPAVCGSYQMSQIENTTLILPPPGNASLVLIIIDFLSVSSVLCPPADLVGQCYVVLSVHVISACSLAAISKLFIPS